MYWLVVCVSILGCAWPASAQTFSWQVQTTGSQASLRGVATARQTNQQAAVIWASGTKGTVLRSLNRGADWSSVGPTAYAELDFRSLHAWDEQSAIMASAGTPAVVLKTSDAGKTWREVYRDPRPAAFFDGLKFIDEKRGVLFGDPIDGRFCVLTTGDAGETWQAIDPAALPQVLPGEAAFAASNSAMIVAPPAEIVIATGGAVRSSSRVMRSMDFGGTWQVEECPLKSNASSGIFSLARSDSTVWVAVGGDYQPGATSTDTAAVRHDTKPFERSRQPPAEYRSSVVYSGGNAKTPAGFYATGPTGTDYSPDGNTWQRVSEVGFHALAVLPDQALVAVGSAGRCGL